MGSNNFKYGSGMENHKAKITRCLMFYRLDVERLKERGMCVIPWTVNKKEEMEQFRDILKIPYLTDFVSLEEQS